MTGGEITVTKSETLLIGDWRLRAEKANALSLVNYPGLAHSRSLKLKEKFSTLTYEL